MCCEVAIKPPMQLTSTLPSTAANEPFSIPTTQAAKTWQIKLNKNKSEIAILHLISLRAMKH